VTRSADEARAALPAAPGFASAHASARRLSDARDTTARRDWQNSPPYARLVAPTIDGPRDAENESVCRLFNPEGAGWSVDASRGPVGTRCLRFLLLDITGFALAALVACAITRVPPSVLVGESGMAMAVLAAMIVATLAACGAYRATARVLNHPALLRAAIAIALAFTLLSATAASILSPPVLRMAMTFLVVVVAVLPFVAAVYHTLLHQPPLEERVVLVGAGALAHAIAHGFAQHRHLGFRIAGHVTDADDPAPELGPRLGRLRDLESVLREFVVDRVVLAGEALDTATEDLLVATKLAGIPVDPGLASFEWLYQRTPIDGAPRETLLDPASLTPGPSFEVVKRTLDLLLASVGLLVLAPVLAFAAAATKVTSRGPIFYGQIRLGRGGRRFRLWKLRSMVDGAERGSGAVCAEQDDARVTPVGRFLRRSRIDEIPQLWNVLRGDMSIVGPRPERPEICESLARRFPMFRYRTAVRPGVTGWAQVRQGYVNQVEGFGVKLSYDLFYLKNRSLALDLRVLWHTAGELLLLKGV